MMKNLCTSLLLVFVFSFSASAQLGMDRLKNQAGNALGRAIDRKIESEMDKIADKMVNRYWDKMVGKYYQGVFSGMDSALMAFPFLLSDSVNIDDQYSFSGNSVIKIESYKKNGKLNETSNMVMHTSDGRDFMAMEVQGEGKKNDNVFIINDFKNKAMIMLMRNDGKNMRITYGYVMDADAMKAWSEKYADKEVTDPKFRELGTKSILGYECRGYAWEDEEGSGEMWLSKEDVYGLQNMFTNAQFGTANKSTNKMPSGYPQGSIMESTFLSKSSGEKSVMTVVEINKNAPLVKKISDYPPLSATGE